MVTGLLGRSLARERLVACLLYGKVVQRTLSLSFLLVKRVRKPFSFSFPPFPADPGRRERHSSSPIAPLFSPSCNTDNFAASTRLTSFTDLLFLPLPAHFLLSLRLQDLTLLRGACRSLFKPV